MAFAVPTLMVFVVEVGNDDDSVLTASQQPVAYLYLAIALPLSWRVIPSLSATLPTGPHHVFDIHHTHVLDPTLDTGAFIRLPVNPTRSYHSLVTQLHKSTDAFLNEAIDDGWEEPEWVYNVLEHLEILDYVGDHVTHMWQYQSKSKMETFVDRVHGLLCELDELGGRVIDFV